MAKASAYKSMREVLSQSCRVQRGALRRYRCPKGECAHTITYRIQLDKLVSVVNGSLSFRRISLTAVAQSSCLMLGQIEETCLDKRMPGWRTAYLTARVREARWHVYHSLAVPALPPRRERFRTRYCRATLKPERRHKQRLSWPASRRCCIENDGKKPTLGVTETLARHR